MAELDLILFDDAVARDWYPFSLTRPAGELLLGTMKLRQRLERVTGTSCRGYLTSSLLSGFDEPDSPSVLNSADLDSRRPLIFLSSRCILNWNVEIDLTAEGTLLVADQVAGWVIPAGGMLPDDGDVLAPASRRGRLQTLDGIMVENVWDLIRLNAGRTASDILHLRPSAKAARPGNAHMIGDYPLVCGDDVAIEPGVVFDLSEGPVMLADGVQVRALSRIAGPLFAGRYTTLLGGSYAASSIGPRCKVHGELEESVIIGFSNKAHDGFLGHAYVGMWVNLGAQTTNSDLKNNYSTVRVTTPGGEVDTGLTKLGSLIGDHVKTAIGTLLNTGTMIGPGANVLETRPGKYVPPFQWGNGVFELEKFIDTARHVMQRRDVELSDSQRALLTRVWNGAAGTVEKS